MSHRHIIEEVTGNVTRLRNIGNKVILANFYNGDKLVHQSLIDRGSSYIVPMELDKYDELQVVYNEVGSGDYKAGRSGEIRFAHHERGSEGKYGYYDDSDGYWYEWDEKGNKTLGLKINGKTYTQTVEEFIENSKT